MNLRIARKILKNIEFTRGLKYSAKQIDRAVQRVRRSLQPFQDDPVIAFQSRYTTKSMAKRKEVTR